MFEQIRSNRRRSAFVVAGLGAVLVATGIALGAMVSGRVGSPEALGGGVAALGLWLVLWMVAIAGGDRILLGIAGAREIRKSDHPQLFNIVEEMTIASALPRPPRVYVIDDPSPNAFATGRSPENAAVAVTTGLLHLLDRDEVQGVIAHEIGHVKNRDVALITTAGVMMGSIIILAELGRRFLWFGGGRRSRSSRKDGGAQAALMVAALVLLVLAPILAQLLYFALSRRREYLADASAAIFTRYPEGLASALEKIGGSRIPLADRSHVTAPMYIAHPRQAAGAAASAFATHPPLADRVRVLRAMGGGAGYQAYEQAWRKSHARPLIGARTLAVTPEVAARAAAAAPAPGDDPAVRGRAASDAFLAASGYSRAACACGAIVKIPPALQGRVTACPRCGAELAAAA